MLLVVQSVLRFSVNNNLNSNGINTFSNDLLYFFAGLRSLPDVVHNDFTETEQMSLLDRGKRAFSESKEYLIHLVLDIIAALIKCESKNDIMNVIGPMIEAGLSFIIRTVVRYLTC